MLTRDLEDLRDPDRAVPFAQRAVIIALNKYKVPVYQYLDTPALPFFETGDVAAAIDTEERALTALPNDWDASKKVFQGNLDKY